MGEEVFAKDSGAKFHENAFSIRRGFTRRNAFRPILEPKYWFLRLSFSMALKIITKQIHIPVDHC